MFKDLRSRLLAMIDWFIPDELRINTAKLW